MSDEIPIADRIHTGRKVAFYTDFSTALDLVALGGFEEAPRQVWVLAAEAASTLQFIEPSGETVSAAGDALVGIPITCGIGTITENTDVDLVMVIW